MTILLFTNNASAATVTPLGISDTTVDVAVGAGALFPAPSAPATAFLGTLTNPATPITVNEIVLVTARSGDTMTITRAQEGTTAQVWPAGSVLQLLVTAGELNSFAQPATLQAQAGNFAQDTGAANAYVAAFSPPIAAPIAGAPLRVHIANTNTGPSTLNVDGTARPVTAQDGTALGPGEIVAGGVTTFIWNGSAYVIGTQTAQVAYSKQVARRCCLMGDSITENCNTDTLDTLPWPDLNISHQNDSWWSWAARLTQQRIFLNPFLNFGIGGNTTADMLGRFAATVMANIANFDILFLMGGTNDVIDGTITPSQTFANLTNMANQVLAEGKVVVMISPPPFGAALNPSTAQRQQLNSAASKCREWAKTQPGVIWVDTVRALTDPTTGINGYNYPPLFFGDGIHPSGGGTYRIGQKVADAISVLLPPGPDVFVSQADQYDPTNNPNGNRVPNGGFTVTSGGTITNGSGALAADFQAQKTSGTWINSEVVFSVVAGAQGLNAPAGNKQHIAVNMAPGNTTNEVVAITSNPQITSLVPGDQIYAEVTMDISSITNMWYAQLGIIDSDGSQFPTNTWDGYDPYGTASANLNLWDPQTYTNLVFRTPIYTVQEGVQIYFKLLFAFNGTAGATATIDLTGATIRKVN